MTESKITPPRELVQQWIDQIYGEPGFEAAIDDIRLAKLAAQWGADQELEACCEWLAIHFAGVEKILRAARRPKPPSDKEQALEALSEMEDECLMVTQAATIRRALKALPDV